MECGLDTTRHWPSVCYIVPPRHCGVLGQAWGGTTAPPQGRAPDRCLADPAIHALTAGPGNSNSHSSTYSNVHKHCWDDEGGMM